MPSKSKKKKPNKPPHAGQPLPVTPAAQALDVAISQAQDGAVESDQRWDRIGRPGWTPRRGGDHTPRSEGSSAAYDESLNAGRDADDEHTFDEGHAGDASSDSDSEPARKRNGNGAQVGDRRYVLQKKKSDYVVDIPPNPELNANLQKRVPDGNMGGQGLGLVGGHLGQLDAPVQSMNDSHPPIGIAPGGVGRQLLQQHGEGAAGGARNFSARDIEAGARGARINPGTSVSSSQKPGMDACAAGVGGSAAPARGKGANSALAFDLTCVTFTGVDDSADVTRICDISWECPEVEWGVLFHPDRAGKPRYASHKWINKLQDAVTRRKSESASAGASRVPGANGKKADRPFAIKLSAHLCGNYCLDLMRGETEFLEVLIKEYGFSRIQINPSRGCGLEKRDLGKFYESYRSVVSAWSDVEFILQVNSFTNGLAFPLMDEPLANLSFLYDNSMGCGKVPVQRPRPLGHAGVHFGYAGGLGANNLVNELKRINAAILQSIDSKLRNAYFNQHYHYYAAHYAPGITGPKPVMNGANDAATAQHINAHAQAAWKAQSALISQALLRSMWVDMESSLRVMRKTGRGAAQDVKTQHICVAPSELQNAEGGGDGSGVVVQTSADAEKKEGEAAKPAVVSSKKSTKKGATSPADFEEVDMFDLDQCERCIHIIKSLGLWRDQLWG